MLFLWFDYIQVVQGSFRDAGTLFEQGDQPTYRIFTVFRCGGKKGIVQLDAEDDQHDLRQRFRIVKVDLAGGDALFDDLSQVRL